MKIMKKGLPEQARIKYRELSEKNKDIKREYGIHTYRNISGKDKQKLRDCQRTIEKQRKQYNFFCTLYLFIIHYILSIIYLHFFTFFCAFFYIYKMS